MPQPLIVGITGTIGSGKSLVGDVLKQRGFTVTDTDQVVHELFATDEGLKRAIAARFGEAVLAGGSINRQTLGAIVFADEKARKQLEALVHPAVLRECDRVIAVHSDEPALFFLVPLLFEAGLAPRYDRIWAVVADESTIRQRLKARSGMSDEQIASRLAAQMPQEQKAARAHARIDNSGDRRETERQIDNLLSELG